VTQYPTFDLDTIKDDLGIPVSDTTLDAWLTRRCEAIWSAFRKYTGQWLSPKATFIDDWRNARDARYAVSYPPGDPRNSVYLTQLPVVAITKCELPNGFELDVTRVIYDPRTGELKNGDISAVSLIDAMVTYEAGNDAIPSDLYDAMIGILTQMYGARQQVQSGIGGMGIDTINVQDVGLIKVRSSSFGFDDKVNSTATMDPLLGPYTATLEGYKDWRNKLGLAGLPIHSVVEPPPAPLKNEALVGGDR